VEPRKEEEEEEEEEEDLKHCSHMIRRDIYCCKVTAMVSEKPRCCHDFETHNVCYLMTVY